MADTNFTNYQTPVVASWLNEINDHVYSDTPVLGRTVTHESATIGYVPQAPLTSTDVQGALDELAAASGTVPDNSISTIKVQDEAITFAKIQNVNENVLLGGADTGSGAGPVQEITIGANLTLSGGVLNASGGSSASGQNRIINGGFSINQRGATSVADDVYCLDRWYVLTSSGNVTVAQQTLQEDGTPFNIRLTQPDVAAKQLGLAQIIEGVNCRDLRGQNATLSLRIRNSTTSQINYAILEWSGAVDSVTSDFISSWAGSPTYIANITERVKGTISPSASTWTDVTAITGAINAAMNNLIVFVWSDTTLAQNETLDIARVKLEKGSAASAFEYLSFTEELSLCQRYLPKWEATAADQVLANGYCFAATSALFNLEHPVTPRIPPTGITTSGTFAPTTSAAGTGGTSAITFASPSRASYTHTVVAMVASSGLVAGNATTLRSNGGAAYILATGCEL